MQPLMYLVAGRISRIPRESGPAENQAPTVFLFSSLKTGSQILKIQNNIFLK